MRRGLSIAALACMAGCGESVGPLLHALDAAVVVDTGAAGAAGAVAGQGGAAGTSSVIRQEMAFQYQLVGAVDPDLDAELYFIDLFNAEDTLIDALHARGKLAVAYLSAGTRESYRSDATQFPAAAVGQRFDEYPQESWLDIRDPGVRAVMAARLDRARTKGFDGVLPTNLTGYRRETGFELTAEDQLNYSGWLADEAHRRGLSIGLAEDFIHLPEIGDRFDLAMGFSCIERGVCAELSPFLQQGKPVFDVETTGEPAAVCAQAAQLGVNAILKRDNYDAYRVGCR